MMRVLSSAIAALVLALALVPAAAASAEWCEYDPLVVISTPGGATVPVYVTSGALGTEHLAAVMSAAISYSATSAEGGEATVVRMTVLIPDDEFASHFATRSVVSTGPLKTGLLLAEATGFSGQAMPLQFKLAVP
jgi:hypothetical protein